MREIYILKRQFNGTTVMGSYRVWISLGNYLDFEGGRNKLHRHSYYEACLVLDGRGELYHNQTKYPLLPGTLFLTAPGIIHEIVSAGDAHLKIQFLYFSFEKNEGAGSGEDESRRLYDRHIEGFLKKPGIRRDGCADLSRKFRQLKAVETESGRINWFLKSESAARDLVLDIISRMSESISDGTMTATADNRLQMALQFMADNADRRFSVKQIADQAGCSTRTLRRLIREACSLTVVQKALELRIKAAAAYLVAHPEKSVAETAFHFNFENPSDFGRGFRQVMKISPGEFRKNSGTSF